eukprot:scaffold395_cov243-Pinguiococcus_pyrenoidosus.AAC.26
MRRAQEGRGIGTEALAPLCHVEVVCVCAPKTTNRPEIENRTLRSFRDWLIGLAGRWIFFCG